MQNRQIDKTTKQIRISREIHKQLKVLAASEGKSLKTLTEELLEQAAGEPLRNQTGTNYEKNKN